MWGYILVEVFRFLSDETIFSEAVHGFLHGKIQCEYELESVACERLCYSAYCTCREVMLNQRSVNFPCGDSLSLDVKFKEKN